MSNVKPPLLSFLLSSLLYFAEAVELTTQLHSSIYFSVYFATLSTVQRKACKEEFVTYVHYPWIFLKGCLVHNLMQHKPGYVLNKIYFFVNCSAPSHQVFDTAGCNVILSRYNIKLPRLLLELS
jgi:hypothetical protein